MSNQPEGNRAARRAHARRQERKVRRGQVAYRKVQEQRRQNEVTAANMAAAAAGELGTPALQRNVRVVLDG